MKSWWRRLLVGSASFGNGSRRRSFQGLNSQNTGFEYIEGFQVALTMDDPMICASDVSTYDEDFFAWTQEQAAALRRLSSEASGTIDIEHVAEEIEDLGRRDLREVKALLGQLVLHLMKIDNADPAQSLPNWRSEACVSAMGACDAFSPSMRRALDVDLIWRTSRKRLARDMADVGASLSAPTASPFTLDELLDDDIDLEVLLAKLKSAER